MKHINLTQMLQGCSKRNGMTVSASNPDGEPTVNRQSRLMLLSGKKAEKEQLSPSCLRSASFPLSFRSRYLRYAAMIFCVLAMNVGNVWGTDYSLIDYSSTPALTTNVHYSTGQSLATGTCPYNEGYTRYIKFSSPSGLTNDPAKFIKYDLQTTKCTLNIAAHAGKIQVNIIKEGEATSATTYDQTSASSVLSIPISTTKNTTVYISANTNANAKFYQVTASETGSALAQAGESGYSASFNAGRTFCKGSGNTGYLDGLSFVGTEGYTPKSTTSIKLKTKGTNYIKFHTGASACKVTVTVSSSNTYYIGTSSSATTNSSTTSQTVDLAANTDYYINPNGSNVNVTAIEFPAPKMIYLKNSMGWSNAYVTLLGTTSYWDASNGTGSYGKTTYTMSYDSSKKLFYVEVPAASNDTYINFTNTKMEGYGNFNSGEGIYVDGGYSFGKVVWLTTTNTFTKNSGAMTYLGTDSYGDGTHVGVGLEDYSADVYLCGSHNDWTKNDAAKFTSGTPYTKTVSLTAGTAYTFKIVDNAWFGLDNTWLMDDKSGLTFSQVGGNVNLLASITGDYTFTYDRSTHAVTVTYPTHTHPCSGYVYVIKYDWTNAYLHAWYDSDHPMTAWGSDLQLSYYEDLCGTDYWCIPVLTYYSNFIVKNQAGDPTDSNTTGDQSFTSNGSKNMYHDGSSWGWHTFDLHTISYAAGTYGSGTMSSTTGICDAADQDLPACSFTPSTGYEFSHWTADVAVTVNSSTVSVGSSIADEATLQNITGDIALTANWSLVDYNVTYSTPSNGSYTIKVGDGTATGATKTANMGSTVAIAATPSDGYYFVGWTVTNTSTSADVTSTLLIGTKPTTASTSFTMPAYGVTVVATFAAKKTVTYKKNGGASGADGSVTGATTDASSPYAGGAEVTTVANGFTNSGYKFKWWNTNYGGTGEDFYPGEKFNISDNTLLYAQWEQVSSGWEYWVGDNFTFTDNVMSVGDLRITRTSSGVSSITDVSEVVSKYNSTTDKKANTLKITSNSKYIQLHFSDGSSINTLKLGVATDQTSNKNIVVCYSTTADFSTGAYEFKGSNVVSVPGKNQSSKGVTDVSPSTSDKYKYVRIYRKLANNTDYNSTGGDLGSGNNTNIYSIKIEKGASCINVAAPTSLSCTAHTQTSLTFGWTKASNASGYTASLYSDSGCESLVSSQNLGDVNTVTFSTLTVGTTYYCKVQSKGDGSTYCEDGGTTSAASGTTDACTSISPTWSYFTNTVAEGITIMPEIGGNTGSGAVTYTSNNTSYIKVYSDGTLYLPYGYAAGSATVTANVAASGVYCSGSVTSPTITIVSDQSGLIKQSLNVNAEWGTPSAPATSGTYASDITSTTVIDKNGDLAIGTGSNKEGMTQKITGMTTGNEAANSGNYMSLGFTVASGKKLNVSAIYIPVQPVSSSTNNFKAVLSDNDDDTDDIVGTLTNAKDGRMTYIKFDPSYGSVAGNVTLKIYAWGWTGGYRLGKSIVIDGETESTATLYDISTSATNGTIAVTVGGASASSAEENATVTITATPSSGYSFSSWTVTDEDEGSVTVTSATTSPTTFTMPAADVTVSATFSEITHTVSVAAGAHGTVSPSSVSGVGIATASGNITATPSTGYSFNGWTLPSGVTAAATYSASSNPISINATSDDLTITATWTANTYTITYNLHDGGAGSLDGEKTSYQITDDDYDLPTPVWTGHTFLGWYATYSDGDYSDPVSVLTSGSTGNKTYHAKWADGVNVVWTITKVDSKLYKGGTGYSVKAVVDNTSWTGHDNLVLSASDGVTLGTPTKSTVDSKAQIVADFSISGSLAEDAITFSLYAPATGVYAAIEDEKEVELDECPSEGGSTTLFSQNFNDATAVAYAKSMARAYTTASTLSGLVGSGDNLFTSITSASGSDAGIAINSSTGKGIDASGIFQGYKNNSDGGYWSIIRTADFATTAPTALKVEMDIWFKSLNSGSYVGVNFAIGDGFSDGLNSTSAQDASKVHSGFSIINGTPKFYAYNSTSSSIESGTFTASTWYTIVWIINNTGESITYDNPTGTGTSTLANDCYDIWRKTTAGLATTYTRVSAGKAATTSTVALQNIYIGANGGKTNEFRLDNIVVTDLNAISGGGVATSLAWSNSQSSGATVKKNDVDADFRIYALPTPSNAGGTISYTSSKESVATVSSDGTVHIVNDGSTTITASMPAYGCYSAATSITYSLVVANTCADTPGTIVNNDGSAIAGDAVNRGACETLTLRLTGHSGSTIQWKKDGGNVGTNSDTYDVPAGESGVYTAVVTGGCALEATNSITVTTADGTPNPTIYANDFYVKSDKWFGYRLMKINEGETVSVKTDPDGWEENTDFFITTDASGIVSISGRKTISTPEDKTLTLTIANECDGSVDKNITIREMAATAKPTIAWIATNNDGGSGQKDNVKADESTNTDLYDYLKDDYIITPRNCYWTTNEADLVKEYSQYDLIILTDYPNSGTCPSGKSGKSNSYTNAIGLLIDHKPIMTFEAFVAGCPNWGIASNPQNTQTTQTDMTLLCNANDIFGTSGKFAAGQAITVTSASSGQALQGFPVASSPDFVFIGKITDSDEKTYVACCERQHEIAARMMVFGLNSSIMSSLTDDGKTMVEGFIEYLLKDDPASIPDCSVIFNGKGGDDSWYTTANWEAGSLPDQYASVRIDAPCVVPANADPAKAGRIKIHQGGAFTGSLTIQPRGRMIVEKTITRIEGDEYTVYKPTEVSDLVLETSEDGNGVLIMGSYDGTNKATVGFYTKAKKTGGHNVNQFIGTPFNDETYVFNNYYGTKIYEFRAAHDGDKGTDNEWIRLPNDGDMRPFYGYNILTNQADERTLWMEGTLVASEDQKMKMYYNGSSNTENMFANSWSAPIDIAQFTASDFGGGVATVYIFNAGTVENYTAMASGSASATSAGQFIVLPIASAPWTSPTVRVIPSMQAFSVFASGSNQTMTLDYDRLVRTRAASMDKDSLTTATRAPRRAAEEPVVMHLRVDGINGYAANMHVLEREDLTDGFDNGWDGHHMVGDEDAPQLYAITEAGKMNVNCVPNMEGTVLGFRAGTDNQFTFSFGYEGEEDWYLNDLKEQKSTLIDDMSSYTFMVEPEDAEARFVISKTPIRQTPTGCESVGAEAAKVRKVIIDDKVYIIRGGRMYSVDGQMVK